MNNKINFNAVKQGNKITMQLEPEFLGKIQMKIGVENGSVTAKILAENNGVKDLLNGNLTKLKTTLEQKGIEIDQFDVSVGYQEEELAEQNQSQQDFLFKQQQEKNRLKNFSLKSEDGQLSTEGVQSEEDETQVIDDQVDYRA
nr:flagellar hook-length control protein FliK [Halanaerobacter jeridensis]